MCSKGYFLNSNRTCSLLPPNCVAADVANLTCIICEFGFILTRGICNKPVLIDNCRLVGPSKTDCLVCQQGYFLSNYTCKRVSSLCNAYDPTTGVCLTCKGGYLNFGGLCVDTNCQIQNSDICTQCKPNFARHANGLCYFFDLNCERANIISCLSCKSGYYNKLGLCVRMPLNCVIVGGDGNCATCLQGYQFYNGNCIVPINYCKIYQSNMTNNSICEMC